jgi:hypothetical protein
MTESSNANAVPGNGAAGEKSSPAAGAAAVSVTPAKAVARAVVRAPKPEGKGFRAWRVDRATGERHEVRPR